MIALFTYVSIRPFVYKIESYIHILGWIINITQFLDDALT